MQNMVFTKHVFNIFLVVIVVVTHAQFANATNTVGTASAQIVQSIEVSEVQDLQFGALSLQGTHGDVITLNTSGVISTSTANIVQGTLSQNAIFNAMGEPNALISLSFQNGFLTGAGSPMSIENFTHDAGASPQLNALGLLIFNVGADLEINDHQSVGNYSGTYQVTVNYQ